jgi:hypothetical protein
MIQRAKPVRVKVLLQFIATRRTMHGPERRRDSIVVEVTRSCDIETEFRVQLQKRDYANNGKYRGLYPEPDDVKLISYFPANGQANFAADYVGELSWNDPHPPLH